METQKEHIGTKTMLVLVVVLLAMNAFSVSAKNQNLINSFSDTSNQAYTLSNEATDINYTINVNSVSFLADNRAMESTALSDKPAYFYEDMEKEIQLEDWMLNSKHNFWKETYYDAEDEIQLEDWMMDASKW